MFWQVGQMDTIQRFSRTFTHTAKWARSCPKGSVMNRWKDMWFYLGIRSISLVPLPRSYPLPHPWPCMLYNIRNRLSFNLRELEVIILHAGFPGSASGKEPACQCRRHKRHEFNPWVGKIPWRRAWQPTSVFLPGESHGQRGLVGYGLWSLKESGVAKSQARLKWLSTAQPSTGILNRMKWNNLHQHHSLRPVN